MLQLKVDKIYRVTSGMPYKREQNKGLFPADSAARERGAQSKPTETVIPEPRNNLAKENADVKDLKAQAIGRGNIDNSIIAEDEPTPAQRQGIFKLSAKSKTFVKKHAPAKEAT